MKKYLKHFIKRLLDVFDLDVHRKITQRLYMKDVLEHIKSLGFNPKTVIDVGVAHGTYELYDIFSDSFHLLIEPLEEFKNSLDDICSKYNAQYVLAAATDKSDTIMINVHNILTGSTVFKEVEGEHVDGVQREVPSVTIDHLCTERNLPGPYMIKLDVHGSEILALNGAKKVMENTELLILEVQMFQVFICGPQFYDIVSYLKTHGFCVYDIFNAQYRPLDGALISVDLAFVKEDGKFRKIHSWATREQREKIERQMI